jgi:nitrogen fixation protein
LPFLRLISVYIRGFEIDAKRRATHSAFDYFFLKDIAEFVVIVVLISISHIIVLFTGWRLHIRESPPEAELPAGIRFVYYKQIPMIYCSISFEAGRAVTEICHEFVMSNEKHGYLFIFIR